MNTDGFAIAATFGIIAGLWLAWVFLMNFPCGFGPCG